MANFNPTAANIIASLGIKGATTGDTSGSYGEEGSRYSGFVPVLGSDGKLSANFIPSGAEQNALPSLSDVAFVDPYTTVSASLRKGSVVAPFISLAEAAASFVPTESAQGAKYVAFMLAPGIYTDAAMTFPTTRAPLHVYLIGLGRCDFAVSVNEFKISNMSGAISGVRPSVWLQGISIAGRVNVAANADVTVVGNSYIGELTGLDGFTLSIASDSRVSSTTTDKIYLSEDQFVKNNTSVPGATVRDAVARLGSRKIRIANVDFDSSSGFVIDSSSSYIDISADSCDGNEVFDLRERDRIFVRGINELFRKSKDVVADTVTATTITADVANIGELNMDYLKLGGYKLSVDTYGYLVVNDGSVTPPQPPTNVILISDTVTGAIYMIGVASGRMYVAPADIDSSSSGSSSSVQEYITVYDPETGYTYSLSIQNGRMVVTRIGG